MAMSRHILHSGVWSGCCTASPPHTSARLQYPLSRSRFQHHCGGSDWLPPQTSDASGHISKTWFCQICTRGAISAVRKYVGCLSNLYLSCFISHQTLDVHFSIRTQIFTSTSVMLICRCLNELCRCERLEWAVSSHWHSTTWMRTVATC